MGQPSVASKKWIDLISKSKELKVSTLEITKALIIMYTSVTKLTNSHYISKHDFKKLKCNFLTQLPIVSAATLGLMDVMEVLAQVGENFDQLYFGQTTSGWHKSRLPLIFAFEAKNFEVVDFILSKMTTPLLNFHCAVEHGHLDLVKRMTPMMNYVNEPWNGKTALRMAIIHNRIEVLKHLAPLLTQSDLQDGFDSAINLNSFNVVNILYSYIAN